MQRRTLIALAPVGTLAACGFRLRGVPEFAFRSLAIAAPAGSSLGRELQRTLDGAGGTLELVRDPAAAAQAEACWTSFPSNASVWSWGRTPPARCASCSCACA